ncbi:putative gustatory receptor 93b [Drosophila sulfurigaster albostrigata]|uniref:putative gustatory receptor 93b n=1 Tax=Drosophila sulfurigaster albostrigata TaxID=89887 RepID=UPI002D21BCED|nr:putative gustatory receptor 93b [Drosophila sulfurigaster albostrigata]
MFGSRFRLSASSATARILRNACNYATALGVITFRVECNRGDGRLVAEQRRWFKWLSMLFRILISYLYCHFYGSFIIVLQNIHFQLIVGVRMFCSLICALVILVMQFWYEEQLIALVNTFLQLFRRVKSLPGCQDMCFGGHRELILLLFGVLCQIYQCFYLLPTLIDEFNIEFTFTAFLETYSSLSTAIICYICFVGYLSVGALFHHMNHYIRHQLRDQLEKLKLSNESREQRKAASYRLDECLAIYEDIQRVSSEFQRLFDVPLCLAIIFGFLTMALVSFFVVLNQFNGFAMWVLEMKIFLELLLLTLSIQGAIHNSRVVRRLSLENYYLTERSDWHKKLEMFLSRLNYNEFRVRPLGLFDVSNELILVFLSALVTYLTYIIQYGMQSNQL